jgi:lysophospholipase
VIPEMDMKCFGKVGFSVLALMAVLEPQMSSASSESQQALGIPFEVKYPLFGKPFFERFGKEGSRVGEGGALLHYKMFRLAPPLERGVVVLVPGYTEALVKYDELIFDLYSAGYSVYALDVRGQGESQHLVMDWSHCEAEGLTFSTGCMSDVVHVEKFDDYVADLKKFRDEVVMRDNHKRKPLFLLGHSMGGLIAARYAEKYTQDFSGVVLNAPMIEMRVPPPMTVDEALAVSQYYVSLGAGRAPVPMFKPYDPETDQFDTSSVTHDTDRFEKNREQRTANFSIAMARPSFQWVAESILAGRSALAGAKDIATPMLLLEAGQDFLVNPLKEEEFCAASAKCRLVQFPDAFHEILMETEEVRSSAVREILKFFRHQR